MNELNLYEIEDDFLTYIGLKAKLLGVNMNYDVQFNYLTYLKLVPFKMLFLDAYDFILFRYSLKRPN
jgi:hypothetical protein